MTTTFVRGITTLATLLILGSAASGWAQGSDRLTVAVIEFQRGSQVLDREYLLRDDFEDLLVERASSRLQGYSESEIRSGRPISIDNPDDPEIDASITTPAMDDPANDDVFDVVTTNVLGEFSIDNMGTEPDLGLDEELDEEEAALAEAADENPALQGIRESLASEGVRLDVERLRALRDFENQILDEWIDRTLLIMEARRQGIEVTETQRADSLYPMLLAQRSRLSGGESDETVVGTRDLESLDQTITMIEQQPDSTQNPSVQRTIREEIEDTIMEMGHDPVDFFKELDENILINQLIRQKVNEIFTEDQLREYHAAHIDQFRLPPLFQYLSVKFLFPQDITSDELEEARDAFDGLARRLRRVDEDMPLDQVIQEWNELMADADDLPGRTYMSLSTHQSQFDIPYPILVALSDLQPGETSRVLEAPIGHSTDGLFIVRLVDIIPIQGEDFEDARSRVEDVFSEQVKQRVIDALRESHQGVMGYHITRNRRGRSLSEMVSRLREEAPSSDSTQMLTPPN